MTVLIHEELTDRILRSAVAVHRALGPGLTEYSYQAALELEMKATQLKFIREQAIPVEFRGAIVGWHRPDFVVEQSVVVEIKSVGRIEPVFIKQVLTYLRVTHLRVGLLLNFNVTSMANEGIKRVVL
jgi:GxxExxY protein